MHTNEPTNRLHGVMAEFDSAQAVVDAARKTMAHGFTRVEAYSPVPVEELNDIIHKKRTILPSTSFGRIVRFLWMMSFSSSMGTGVYASTFVNPCAIVWRAASTSV